MSCRFNSCLVIASALLITAAGRQDSNQQVPASSGAPDAAGDQIDEQPLERRNPRRIPRTDDRPQRPRMVAGGMSIENPIEFYIRLEPLIGEFAFEGRSWRVPDTAPIEFTGRWTNEWVLDGYYLKSEFTIDSEADYTVMGMTCYDVSLRRYESHFYNSASAVRTFRYGDFKEGGRVLAMDTYFSNRPDAASTSRIELEIVDDNRFTFTGWQQRTDGDWWKSYEMIATRVSATAQAGAAD